MRSLKAALEQSSKELEREYTWYIRVENTQFLSGADHKEEHIQVHMGDHGGIKLRLRKTDDTYTLTTKRKVKDNTNMVSDVEVNQDITEDLFNELSRSTLADLVYHKTRYIFNINNTNLKWEVDVFSLDSGDTSEWMKVDLEVPEGSDISELPDFPIVPLETYMANADDPKGDDLIDRLWTKDWPITVDPDKTPTPTKEG